MFPIVVFLLVLQPRALARHDESLVEKGRAELSRVQNLATQPRYGACWVRALEELDTRCRDLTARTQREMALQFTRCHLTSSGRGLPACPVGSEVTACTRQMEDGQFSVYTHFFTHTLSMCHFLQAEAWQHRSEGAVHRLTQASAAAALRLQETQRLAEQLQEVQSAALLAQEEMLSRTLTQGEQLQHSLGEAGQGLRQVLTDVRLSSRDQQVLLSELFNRISFLSNFLLTETHTLSSVLYNGCALLLCYLLTSAPRTSRARLVLMALVCLNVYLERTIYQRLLQSDSSNALEQVSWYTGAVRRVSGGLGLLVLLLAALRYRDPTRESLEVLRQLKLTQSSLEQMLKQAEGLSVARKGRKRDHPDQQRRTGREENRGTEEDQREATCLSAWRTTDMSYLPHLSDKDMVSSTLSSWSEDTHITHNAPVRTPSASSQAGRGGGVPTVTPPSPLVYSVLVEQAKPRYSLRSRRSLNTP